MFKDIIGKCLIVLMFVTICFKNGDCADGNKVFKSLIFPGIGQLSDGDQIKGLTFMAGGVVLISLAIDQAAKNYAYADATKKLGIKKTRIAENHETDSTIGAQWQNAYDNGNKAKTLALTFAGSAVVWWGLNILDVIVFPSKNIDSTSKLKRNLDNVSLTTNLSTTQVQYTYEF